MQARAHSKHVLKEVNKAKPLRPLSSYYSGIINWSEMLWKSGDLNEDTASVQWLSPSEPLFFICRKTSPANIIAFCSVDSQELCFLIGRVSMVEGVSVSPPAYVHIRWFLDF